MKDTAFDIISLNENAVLVEGKLYKKNEVVKTIRTDIEGIASTSADLLPYGKYGNVYIVVDMELKGLIREALIKMILGFDIALEIEEE